MMNCFRNALAFLIISLAAVSSFGETYWVAPPPAGNDTNPGSEGLPWATLQHAADTLQPGDEVIVAAGSYTGAHITTSGTSTNPITYRAADGEVVSITADNSHTPDGLNVEGADWIVIQGFTANDRTRAGIRAVECRHVTIRNNSCDGNGRWGIFTGFCDDLTIEYNKASGSIAEHGIYVSNSGDRPVIRGNEIWGNPSSGIHMNGDVSMGGDGIISDALVEDNIIWNNGVNGGSAINMDGVQESIVRNNLAYDAHASGISLYRIDGGGPSSDNRVLNNTIVVAADGRWALNIQNGSAGSEVRNNTLWSNHTTRGAISICPTCLTDFTSDHNAVKNRFTTDNGSTYLTLAEWRTETGQGTDSKVATPHQLFQDPAGDDYHLKAGSPAIDAGETRMDVPHDIEGRSRPLGLSHDIGAYETPHEAPPMAPSDLVATSISDTQIDLAWVDNSNDEDEFRIYRSFGETFTLWQTVEANTTSASNTGLVECTSASYYVVAYSLNGVSAPSNTDSATTIGLLPDIPAYLEATAIDHTQVDLTWSNGIVTQTAVEIQRATGEGEFEDIAHVSGVTRQYEDTTVEPETTYTYRVRAVNDCGSSDWSDICEIMTPDDGGDPLNPAFDWTPTTPYENQSVAFSGASPGKPTTWRWTFGDGTETTGQHVNHTFMSPGIYTVELTVTKGEASAKVSHAITVLGINQLVAASAHKQGNKGTFWTTNMALTNVDDATTSGWIRFYSGDGPVTLELPFSIKPRFMMTFDDIVGSLLQNKTGALSIDLDPGVASPLITTRTSTPGEVGTYGHATLGQRPLEPGTYYITGVRGGPGFRTNFGIAVPFNGAASAKITLLLPSGPVAGPTLTRPAKTMAQWGIEDIWGTPILEGIQAATLKVELTGRAVIYIATVDELSGDPVYIPAGSASTTWQIPLIGRGSGKRGTFWDTDIMIYNPNSHPTSVELEWLAADLDNRGNTPKATLVLAPHETRLVENAPLTLWDVNKGNGSVMVNASRNVVIEARTWTPVPDGLPGTMGQRIVPIDLEHDRPAPAALPWVREDSIVRTNLGFVNRSNKMMELQLQLLRVTGIVSRTGSILLAPRSVSQRSLEFLFGAGGLAEGKSGWVRVTGSTGDNEVFASQIVNDSGDPIFVPAG
ncbi:MAG: PKD domain-containing protein [bacterium]|nr:PKD domain-containing protein [bacterium]